ncbi:hypothetical protein [Cerasicoccus frondis]|uniref:hypothetical protein n=1 Tax=Cerasicoccus frondis TaxID=490090 RepID=UPI00285299E3|nr:hypothetical protein [Cerasicoccus frondis]
MPLFLAAAFMLLILAVGAIWLMNQWKPEDTVTEAALLDVEPEPDAETLELIQYDNAPRDLQELIDRYGAAQGGPDKIDQIRSLRLKGVIHQNDEELEFQQIKRVPSSSRFSIATNDLELVTYTNGVEAWRQYGGHPENYRVTGDERDSVIRDSIIISPIWIYRDDPNVVSRMSDEMLDGVVYHRVKVILPGQREAVYWIDPETYVEKQIVTTNADGKQNVTQFKDYRKLGWLTIPYEIDFTVDDKVISKIELEKAELNIGVFESYFDPPEMVGDWPPQSGAN